MKTFLLVIGGLLIGAIVTTFVLSSLGQAPEVVIRATDSVSDRLTEGIAPEDSAPAPELTDAQKITAAVSAVRPSTVTIHALAEMDEDLTGQEISDLLVDTFVARGVMVSVDGDDSVEVVSASGLFEAGTDYSVQIPGQKGVYPIEDLLETGLIARFMITAENVRVVSVNENPATENDPVVALGGTTELQIAGSVIKGEEVVGDERIITTAIPNALTPGTPLVNIEEEVIGIAPADSEEGSAAVFAVVEEG